jgi:hypothetical protein
VKVVNVYMTEWGQFTIPDRIFKKTKWKTIKRPASWVDGDELITEPLPVPENWPFFKWLDEQERRAGKN